jgi:hypothetical protein
MVTPQFSNKTAIFDAGSRVYFHANSGLIVSNKGSLQINGSTSTKASLENEVIFEGDRLALYDNVPGQWCYLVNMVALIILLITLL